MRVAVLFFLGASLAVPAFAQESQPTGVAPASGKAAASHPEETTKVFIGAGLGVGFGARYHVNGTSITFADQLQGSSDESPVVAVNVASFGIAFAPGLYAGLDLSGIAQSGHVAGNNTNLQISNYFAALTYFPWEAGLFLRAGVGYSSFIRSVGSQSDQSGGLGVLVGAGFAFKLTGAHHLSLTVEQTWQSYGGSSATKPDSSQAGAVYLGYMWKT